MGATSKYALPWPAPTALLKDGATAIRQLAEAVEAALLPPLIVTDGDGAVTWTAKVGEVPWDITDDPSRKRGGWDSNTASERLVIPTKPGYYFVSTTIRFAGKAEPDVYQVGVMTRAVGSAEGSGTVWARNRIELPDNSDSFTELTVGTIVRVADTTPRTGIAIRLEYAGSTVPPASPAGSNKFRAHWMSAL